MKAYYRYWGKAGKEDGSYHLLPYHCLDVAAVAAEWWSQSSVIRQQCMYITTLSEQQTKAWLLFFITLHDLGKFDVRFQLKSSQTALNLWSGFALADESQCTTYYHGNYSLYWLFHDLDPRFQWDDEWGDAELWDAWESWIAAVAGHHGRIPQLDGTPPNCAPATLEHDRNARLAFVDAIAALFLTPVGLSLEDMPPAIDQGFLAGFCAVSDWLGSMESNAAGELRFSYVEQSLDLSEYFATRRSIAKQILKESGLIQSAVSAGGMTTLFPRYKPRQVQTLVDRMPLQSGLTIIEAPTGSGKTEAALAYASRLLAEGVAEGIIFALPTQATANAMFDRLLQVTTTLYHDGNLLLAHGKAKFNEQFMNLKAIAYKRNLQDLTYETEASVQCSQWLSQSRKRVFLGQVGVCTIDQVLISVLPVKHNFVRSFGLAKSILIVDEVHAYDSYMYGLLESVLKKQKQVFGSAILLSATLPHYQKNNLIAAWGGRLKENEQGEAYPLVTHMAQAMSSFELPNDEQRMLQQSAKSVYIDSVSSPDMQFSDATLDRVLDAANMGANVVLICNLVADAQHTAVRLRERGSTVVDLFHSRYRFCDRRDKETSVLQAYGKGEQRKSGGILVATQVVEQSLDLDFDWMLTQLCPMDLLFQRLGRLHRHDRVRPQGFEEPRCSVIVPINHDYDLHKLIYGNKDAPNARVLWRTETLLQQHPVLTFPDVYRPLIELVYQEDAWIDEPEQVQQEYDRFVACEQATRYTSLRLANSQTHFDDSDAKTATLTRDGEMSLNVLPVIDTGKEKTFLDGQCIAALDEWLLAEALSMNTIPVPASWQRKGLPAMEEGIVWLPMEKDHEGSWKSTTGKTLLVYSLTEGLRMLEGHR
jgi:CRISPR-associated endonuclease/helicase Cas3